MSNAQDSLAPTWPAGWPILLFLASAACCFSVYSPALNGEFISDDRAYITENPYMDSPGGETILEFMTPFSDSHAHTANFAPIHLTAHALQRQIFGDEVFGYHITNVLLHALNSVLFVALLLTSRVRESTALIGGAIFALHPANVEAVAWISQLKSVLAMTFALTALIMHRRWPLASAVPFLLGLLTKAMASFALPFAIALVWSRGGLSRRYAAAFAIWGVLLALYLIPQFAAHNTAVTIDVEEYSSFGVHIRSMAAYGARYLVMAASSYGVAPFQQPDLAISVFDPWWLLAFLFGALLVWRIVVTLRARREEAAWWIAAAAAFAPISQWVPFHSAVADRYLYFILPGLIGGVLLMTSEFAERLGPRRALVSRATMAITLVLLIFFGVQSHHRARHWQFEGFLMAEAMREDPESMYGHFETGVRSMHRGDISGAVDSLRASIRRGMDPRKVWSSSRLEQIRAEPEFAELLRVELEAWLEHHRRNSGSSRPILAGMARVEYILGRPEKAIELMQRALAAEGPFEEPIRQELAAWQTMTSAGE